MEGWSWYLKHVHAAFKVFIISQKVGGNFLLICKAGYWKRSSLCVLYSVLHQHGAAFKKHADVMLLVVATKYRERNEYFAILKGLWGSFAVAF